jgi:hypothetical protein
MNEPLAFDDLVDVLRERLYDADALEPSELHSFKTLLADGAHWIPPGWYHRLCEELKAQGHLSHAAIVPGFDAHARLNADGRLYVRQLRAA